MIPLWLVWADAPADAGLGSLVRAAAKIGSSAGKAGGAAVKGAGAAAKGGAAFKGASALGAAVAAERVFAHTADDAARMGVYVASSDDGLRVVLEGGDELSHTPASFSRFVDDLDEMARVSDDAGVDVYVDADALPHLASLELGPNTRLFLANTDGPSIPLRVAADGMAEVGTKRTWLRPGRVLDDVALELLEAAVDLADDRLDRPVRLVVTDPDCGPVPGALAAPAAARAGELVVVLGPFAGDVPPGVDVVVPGIDDPCPAAGGGAIDALRARVLAASTVEDLWTLGAVDAAPVLAEVRLEGSRLVVRGAGLLGTHVLAAPAEGSDDPPWWFVAGAVVLGAVFVGWKVRRARAAAA